MGRDGSHLEMGMMVQSKKRAIAAGEGIKGYGYL